MKLDGNTFKRLQRMITELSNVDLPEQDLIKITVAGIKAHRHRRKGTTFSQNQLEYQLRKIKEMTFEELLDSMFYADFENFDDGSLESEPVTTFGKIKLWFEDVPEKIKNIRR